jgi:uncharacterized protein (TIGR03083 family)
MLDLDQARAVALREADRSIDLLAEAAGSEWTKPTRCEGWDVSAIAHHLTLILELYAEMAGRLGVGDSERVPFPDGMPARDRGATLELLRAGQRRFADALGTLTQDVKDRLLPHPHLDVPGDLGLNLFALELGLHTDDIADALGDTAPLPQQVAHAALSFAARQASTWSDTTGARPAAPADYVLVGSTVRIGLAWDGSTWSREEVQDGRRCELRGDDGALARFVYGREPFDTGRLRLLGDESLARDFKRFFPGP